MSIRNIAVLVSLVALLTTAARCDESGKRHNDKTDEATTRNIPGEPEDKTTADENASDRKTASSESDDKSGQKVESNPGDRDAGKLDRDAVSKCVKKCLENNKMRSVPMPQIRSDCEQECTGMTD